MTKKDESKLSILGTKAEKVLKKALDDIEADFKHGKEKYSLTDLMKVMDRVLKLEAIRMKINDADEGSFFTQPIEDDDDEEEGAENEDE